MAKSTYVENATTDDDLVIANYPWALHLAKSHYTGTSFDDDIRSAAVLGLVKAVSKLEAGHKPEGTTTSYVRNYVKGEIMEVIRNRRLIPIPNTSLRRRRKRGDSTAITILYDADTEERRTLLGRTAIVNPTVGVDTMADLLKELNFNESEMLVLEQRLEGKTIREVAESLTIEKSMVGLLIKAMKRRWKKWMSGV